MLDLTVSGSSMPERTSFQLSAPGASVVRFHSATKGETSTGKEVLVLSVVSLNEIENLPDHRSSHLYGKHQFSETNMYFTERAIKTVTQGFIAHILEAMNIKDKFIAHMSTVSNPGIDDYANALNKFLQGKEMAVIFGARASYKEKDNGEYARYLNNDGIYMLGLNDPNNAAANQRRFSIATPDKLDELQRWAEHNMDKLVRDAGQPTQTSPTSPTNTPFDENSYEF